MVLPKSVPGSGVFCHELTPRDEELAPWELLGLLAGK